MRKARFTTVLVLGSAGCAPAPRDAVAPVALPVASSSARVAPVAPQARWQMRGASSVGVRADGGRLALVDGARVWLGDDGRISRSSDATRLDGLARAPAAGGPAWIAWRGRTLLRLESPLGRAIPLAVLADDIVSVSTSPDALLVRTTGSVRWLDLSGRERPAAGALPPDAVAFVDPRVGAAIFPGSGLATTLDGGSTWRLVDAPGASRIDADEGWLRLRAAGRAGADARLDAATGALAAPPSSREPAAAEWLRTTEPTLEGALGLGVDLGGGVALLAVGASLFTVDTSTGLPTSRAPLGDLPAGAAAVRWAASSFESQSGARRAYLSSSGMPLLEVTLDSERRVRELLPPGRAIVTSTTGGALREGPCPGDPQGASAFVACVRRATGEFRTVHGPRLDGAGPLVDGGIVGVSREGAEPSLVAVDGDGRTTVVGSLDLGPGVVPNVSGTVDELGPGVFVVPLGWSDATGRQAAVVAVREGRAHVARVGGGEVACRAGRCVVARADGSLASSVDGRSFREEARATGQGSRPRRAPIVGELGWLAERWLHVGWGPAGEPPTDPEQGPPTLSTPARRRLTLRCERGRERPRSLATLAAVEGDPSAMTRALSPPRAARAARESHTHGIGAFPAQGVLARDTTPGASSTLSLGWTDHTEVGARRRDARGPAVVEGLPYVEALFARRALAVFVGTLGSDRWMGRARDGVLTVGRSPVVGSISSGAFADDGAFAWWDEAGIGLWPARGAPSLLTRAARGPTVGAPTPDGVPLLAWGDGWAAVRMVPTNAAAAPLDVAGWQRAAWSPLTLAELPVCRADSTGWRFDVQGDVDVRIAGAPDVDARSIVAIRADASAACVERVTSVGSARFARIDLTRGEAEGGDVGNDARVTALACRKD